MLGHNISSRSGQNGNNNTWDVWEMGNNANHNLLYMTASTAAVTIAEPPSGSGMCSDATAGHALMCNNNPRGGYGEDNGVVVVHHGQLQQQDSFSNLYDGDHHHLHHQHRCGSHYLPDPHLMCLKLGKRHYFEDAPAPLLDHRHVEGFPLAVGGMKRGKNLYGAGGGSSASSLKVPRCQVEGCHVALVSAKEYHRRHKVCEMHSKASKVVVLGLEQRFCQQCSRSVYQHKYFEVKQFFIFWSNILLNQFIK